MKKRQLDHFDILEAKRAYAEGKNITELLCFQKNTKSINSEIIEAVYDLQAGSYIEIVKNNPIKSNLYCLELANIIDDYISSDDKLLDIGTGELTTISQVLLLLKNKPKSVYAFDVSWSRIYNGNIYAKELMGFEYKSLNTFVADMSEIPLLDKSINITTSSHALEPNGVNLKNILKELFRITIDKLILFEPCYEINSEQGKKRMNKLGYIKNIDGIIKEIGGEIENKIVIKNITNPLNPTVCFIVNPPFCNKKNITKLNDESNLFSVPGTNFEINKFDSYYFSNKLGLCYPVLKSIPILKSSSSILASSLCVT